MRRSYNIYSFGLHVESDDHDLSRLEVLNDFGHFENEPLIGHAAIKIEKIAPADIKKLGVRIFSTKSCEVRQLSLSRRQMIYEFTPELRAEVIDDTSGSIRRISLRCLNPEFADDILYFVINSISGEYLEFYGKMRLHAVGFSADGSGGLVFGSPGSGKSTLALQMLEKSDYGIFADEICLFDLNSKKLLAYPLPVGASDKAASRRKFNYLFSGKNLTPIPERRIAFPAPLKTVSFLTDAGRFPRMQLLCQVLLGIGLTQMTEYFVRLNNADVLLRILFNRVRLVLELQKFPLKIVGRSPDSGNKLKAFEVARNS